MTIVLLSILLGAICAVGSWVAVSAHAIIEKIVRLGGRPFPTGEP